MKRSLFLVPLVLVLSAVYFLFNDPAISETTSTQDCCVDIAISNQDGNFAGCQIRVMDGTKQVMEAVTDNYGLVQACDLVEGKTYTVILCGDCRPDGENVVEFTACKEDRVAFTCY